MQNFHFREFQQKKIKNEFPTPLRLHIVYMLLCAYI